LRPSECGRSEQLQDITAPTAQPSRELAQDPELVLKRIEACSRRGLIRAHASDRARARSHPADASLWGRSRRVVLGAC
jgi:hypothetical protein